MSTLADELATHHAVKGPGCTVPAALAQLSAEDAATAQGILDGRSGYAFLSRALDRRGIRAGSTTLSRHARGECGCDTR